MKTAEMDIAESRRFRRTEKTLKSEARIESPGLLGSVTRVLGTVLALAQSRIELIAVELREEKRRALALVVLGAMLAFMGFMSMVAIMALVVFLLWDNA